MAEKVFTILVGEEQCMEIASVITVPEMSLSEAGYITTSTLQSGMHEKHEFHAMSQVAYYQYQDDELEITWVKKPMSVHRGMDKLPIEKGVVICRDLAGNIHVYAHNGQNVKKLLEAAHRFCTRWIRLDI